MKRSIFIQQMKDKLEGTPINHITWASDILDVIEELGMIPPIEPGRTVYDLDLGIPEWEPEEDNAD